MYKKLFKPFFDFLLAFFGLLMLSPIFLIITIGLFFANKGKPFFFQKRPGKKERIFKIIKYRTMTDQKDADGSLLPDSERLTTIGKIVRKTSLDELPQLLNVLLGDMSFVGPRPLLPEYLPLYNTNQKKRHDVKPGITGWAQVHGRNAISWEHKFEHDVWYVNHLNFWIDLKIVLLTIKKVFVSEGVTSAGQATTEPFTGSN